MILGAVHFFVSPSPCMQNEVNVKAVLSATMSTHIADAGKVPKYIEGIGINMYRVSSARCGR